MVEKPIAELIVKGLQAKGLDMKEASLKLGKNHAYLQQFLNRGVPRQLPENVRETLAAMISVDPNELRTGPKKQTLDQLRHKISVVGKSVGASTKGKGAGTTSIIELDVRAAAGAGALVEYEDPVGEWRMPSAVLRLQTRSPETELRIITATGDSMEPIIPPGTRVLVDTLDKRPSPPGVFVVDDGVGIVIKRVQLIPGSEPVAIRLSSDNPHYPPYERTLEEAAILGRVIGRWVWM